jgi:hypothetical protein
VLKRSAKVDRRKQPPQKTTSTLTPPSSGRHITTMLKRDTNLDELDRHLRDEEVERLIAKNAHIGVRRFDVANYLKTPEDVAFYREAAAEDGDLRLIAEAEDDIAQAEARWAGKQELPRTRSDRSPRA